MGGLADLIFGTQSPFSQFVDTNRNTLHQAGAGFASGQNFGGGLAAAAQGAAQGSREDDAYAMALKDQQSRLAQIDYEHQLQQNALGLQVQQRNSTADWVAKNGHPELADAIRAGAISGSDVFAQMYKPGTTIPAGGAYLPNQFNATGAPAPASPSSPPSFGSDIAPLGSMRGAPQSFASSPLGAQPVSGQPMSAGPNGMIMVPPAPAPGYRNNLDGTQAFIPGGQGDPKTIAAQISATDRAKAAAAKPEQMVAAQNSLNQLKQSDAIVTDFIGKALDLAKNPLATGLVGKASETIPGTPAYNLSKALDTIRANIGFDKLAQMRAASPSGGALGQVSNFEEQLLQSVLGSLDQGQDSATITGNLQRLLDYMSVNDKQRLDAFNADFGGVQNPSGGTASQPSMPNANVTSTGVQWSVGP